MLRDSKAKQLGAWASDTQAQLFQVPDWVAVGRKASGHLAVPELPRRAPHGLPVRTSMPTPASASWLSGRSLSLPHKVAQQVPSVPSRDPSGWTVSVPQHPRGVSFLHSGQPSSPLANLPQQVWWRRNRACVPSWSSCPQGWSHSGRLRISPQTLRMCPQLSLLPPGWLTWLWALPCPLLKVVTS